MAAHPVNLTKLCRMCGQQLTNDTYFVNKGLTDIQDLQIYIFCLLKMTTQDSYTSTKICQKCYSTGTNIENRAASSLALYVLSLQQ